MISTVMMNDPYCLGELSLRSWWMIPTVLVNDPYCFVNDPYCLGECSCTVLVNDPYCLVNDPYRLAWLVLALFAAERWLGQEDMPVGH